MRIDGLPNLQKVSQPNQRTAKGSMINPTYARRWRSPSSTSLRKKDCQRSGQPTILGRQMIKFEGSTFWSVPFFFETRFLLAPM